MPRKVRPAGAFGGVRSDRRRHRYGGGSRHEREREHEGPDAWDEGDRLGPGDVDPPGRGELRGRGRTGGAGTPERRGPYGAPRPDGGSARPHRGAAGGYLRDRGEGADRGGRGSQDPAAAGEPARGADARGLAERQGGHEARRADGGDPHTHGGATDDPAARDPRAVDSRAEGSDGPRRTGRTAGRQARRGTRRAARATRSASGADASRCSLPSRMPSRMRASYNRRLTSSDDPGGADVGGESGVRVESSPTTPVWSPAPPPATRRPSASSSSGGRDLSPRSCNG